MSPRLSQRRLVAALLGVSIGSGVTLLLLRLRMVETNLPHFGFLAWNLFLAWVPLVLALVMLSLHKLRAPTIAIAIVGVPWLLFLPNAPYLATDVIHLRTEWGGVPPWFDAILVVSAGVTGVLIGYTALYTVHGIVEERLGALPGWVFAVVTLPVVAVGVYLGRVLRFNSWDAIVDSGEVFRVTIGRSSLPENPFVLAAISLMAVLLLGGYIVFLAAAGAAGDIVNGRRKSA